MLQDTLSKTNRISHSFFYDQFLWRLELWNCQFFCDSFNFYLLEFGNGGLDLGKKTQAAGFMSNFASKMIQISCCCWSQEHVELHVDYRYLHLNYMQTLEVSKMLFWDITEMVYPGRASYIHFFCPSSSFSSFFDFIFSMPFQGTSGWGRRGRHVLPEQCSQQTSSSGLLLSKW